MNEWLRTYGWKFVLALIVVAAALAYLIHADRVAHGEARVRSAPAVALASGRG